MINFFGLHSFIGSGVESAALIISSIVVCANLKLFQKLFATNVEAQLNDEPSSKKINDAFI